MSAPVEEHAHCRQKLHYMAADQVTWGASSSKQQLLPSAKFLSQDERKKCSGSGDVSGLFGRGKFDLEEKVELFYTERGGEVLLCLAESALVLLPILTAFLHSHSRLMTTSTSTSTRTQVT